MHALHFLTEGASQHYKTVIYRRNYKSWASWDVRTKQYDRRQKVLLTYYYLSGESLPSFTARFPYLILCNNLYIIDQQETSVHQLIKGTPYKNISNTKFHICQTCQNPHYFSSLVITVSNVVSIPSTKHVRLINF